MRNRTHKIYKGKNSYYFVYDNNIRVSIFKAEDLKLIYKRYIENLIK